MEGYEGGGCYADEFFRVEERREEGFVSYTAADLGGRGWGRDRIGFSGLADTAFADEIEPILASISDSLLRQWLRYTDDGLPDLQISAKRRLNCERRRASYLSPGFDKNLLVFMSPHWPIGLRFGHIPDEGLAGNRAKQRGLEDAIVKFPELIETGLRFLERQLIGRRTVLRFRDESAGELIVEPKWGPPSKTEILNLAQYKVTISRNRFVPVRAVLFGTYLPVEHWVTLAQSEIEWRETTREQLIQFLRQKPDKTLASLFAK
jgi:hypothetical protein